MERIRAKGTKERKPVEEIIIEKLEEGKKSSSELT